MQAGFDFFVTRRFLPLFGTQFMGAFNDNLLRTAVVVLISYYGLSFLGLPAEQLVNLAAGIFILPFFLFSATAGKVSECFDKARIARVVKLAEVGIMLLTGAGLFLHSTPMLLGALFLMGTHSTFFGPLKYSVLPQYLNSHELVGGNGLIEMGTFLAILFGQIIGSLMMHHGPLAATAITLATALTGYGFSRAMPPAPPTAQHLKLSLNVVADSSRLVRSAWRIDGVRSAILGISWFWLMGAVYTTQLPTFTRLHLGGNADVYTLLLAVFSVGIGAGSVLCAKLSRGRLQLGLVLAGSLGMTVAGTDLALGALPLYRGALLDIATFVQSGGNWHHIVDLACLGFFGGFFTVPLYTWLQTASPDAFRSQAVAANNIINGFYMVAAALASALLLGWLHNIAMLFLAVSLINVLALALLVRGAPIIWKTRLAWLGR
ncbi:MFS transporter [Paludibacterium purpuratum]|uniref:MFS transporter n=1 Tax=Paludibacterium purpuratum TaxID=1144873 RepID=A0A4R7AY28_9NEIS|nr:MFS transporter [Paludibacterium purpuratum]TDR71609.1 MFS transporter [Paludibacterium purpuratum]